MPKMVYNLKRLPRDAFKESVDNLDRALQWHEKHPERKYLTPADVTNVNNVLLAFNSALALKVAKI